MKFATPRQPMTPNAPRATLGQLARQALHRRFPESRHADAHWESNTNIGWVRWPNEDGRWVYCSIRRRSHLITAEIGVGPEPVPIDQLPSISRLADASPDGWRIALGQLIHGHEKSWSSGGNEAAFLERLDWLAQQLRLRVHAALGAGSPRAA